MRFNNAPHVTMVNGRRPIFIPWSTAIVTLLCLLICGGGVVHVHGEHVRELEVGEGVDIGYRIGFIGEFSQGLDSGPPYLIVPVPGSAVDNDLAIDHTTGEIRTKTALDRETRSSYSLVAIPLSGENIRVVIRVLDENDNAPTFPQSVMSIEFPENTPRDVKRTLFPARDADLGRYNTQRYNIVSGNTNNAFRLSSHRERDGVLYLDLQINGFLDREITPAYQLLIEALDGGTPPLKGQMLVNITIQDVNDNQPIFNQSRYFASVPENATVDTTVLQVFATDVDIGENGQIQYSINRRQSDKEQMFRIDSQSGLIVVNKPLDFEAKELHELVVVARDNGLQPLETTAFISIRVTDVNDNQPTINVIFLSDDATPKISEAAVSGDFVARISVNDPDSKTEYANVNVTLTGGDGHFGLTTRDNIIYLVIVSLPLDREVQPSYTLEVVATDTGMPPLHATKTIYLHVTDVNDNAPEFDQAVYYANVPEVADPGTSVININALDRDEGNNSVIQYFLIDTPETHSHWFQVDQKTGVITTRSHIDCETEPVPQLIVVARDGGEPALSSTAKVLVTIHDVNDNEPIFDHSYYNASIPENESKGRCILKVSATDPDCGINSIINYTVGGIIPQTIPFEVKATTGEICISQSLDFELQNSFEFSVIATDRGGLSTTTMVQIALVDVNDNHPIFYPNQYNASLRTPFTSVNVPIVSIVARDEDSGRFGKVSYRITAGNDAGLFRIDRETGDLFVTRPNTITAGPSSHKCYHLNVSASDGGGLRSAEDAEVSVCVSDSNISTPVFEKPRYHFNIKENVKRLTILGSVKANVGLSSAKLRYSINSGDPEGFFNIEPLSGNIKVNRTLDHETKPYIILNIKAYSEDSPNAGHSQVHIDIDDVNDNAPQFQSSSVRLSIPENTELGSPIYLVKAKDLDSENNGKIAFSLASDNNTAWMEKRYSKEATSENLFQIDEESGLLTLKQHLDYEQSKRHSFIVIATDFGRPRQSANMSILVDVQDVNDNAPQFDRAVYQVKVSESMSINSQILQVVATDKDVGNNARISYQISSTNSTISAKCSISQLFGIAPNSGWLYLKNNLDREKCEYHEILVRAIDNGNPPASTTAQILITVLDFNDNAPKFEFEKYNFTIEENLEKNSIVGAVKATDLDSDNNAIIRYSLLGINTSFKIHPNTGLITTLKALDREITSSYDLVAEAKDLGSPVKSSRVNIRILVSDINDNEPIIVDPQEDVVSVREQQPMGATVVRVRAIDQDNGINSTITYSILRNRDSDGYEVFEIDSNTGIIKTNAMLDHDDRSMYRIAIAATDNGVPPKQSVRLLRIEVLDLNDNRPTFTSASLQFKIKENVPVGHIVGILRDDVTDQNNYAAGMNYDITYSMTSIIKPTDGDHFDIDKKTGTLVVAHPLDREQQQEYKLEIRALDLRQINNPQSVAINVDIEIEDVNDNAPRWIDDPIKFNVTEDSEPGTVIHNFTAIDQDSGLNGLIRYTIVLQTPDHPDLFEIDSLTGSLRLKGVLDFENVTSYIICLEAVDQAANTNDRLAATVTIQINVMDVNDNEPEFIIPSKDYSLITLHGIPNVADPITRIVAFDKDSGENGIIGYKIVHGNNDGYFAIDSSSGEITLAKSLLDSNQMSRFSKQFLNNNVDVGRHLPNPTWNFQITVMAHDSNGLNPKESRRVIKIKVESTKSKPPRFIDSTYYVNITENIESGSFVVRVEAKTFDSSNGSTVKYEIPKGSADNKFSIDSQSGIISTRGGFDREMVGAYKFAVFVMDASLHRTSKGSELNKNSANFHFDMATVVVTILDVNDNAPAFLSGSCYTLAVPENNELAVIHTVAAYDIDAGVNGEIIYSITGGNHGNKFSIDMHSGELSARPLDREQTSKYTIQVTAQDRGKPISLQAKCNITIIVDDQNDNDPRFEMDKYSITIAEDVAVSSSILQVRATDSDWGINAKLTYSLSNETHWLFAIDNKSGIISTTGTFDRESKSSYEFAVIATDGGKYDSRSQQVPVLVIISDVNDNAPIFDKYPFTTKVPSLIQPGQIIVQVNAIDIDQGTNGEIFYSLVKSPSNEKFRLNPTTGVVSAQQSLATESGKIVYIDIMASDKGNPPLSTRGLIELRIGEIPYSYPTLKFTNSTFEFSLQEHSPIETIMRLQAIRSDGRRNKIQYLLADHKDSEAFSIDIHSGELRIEDRDKLDFEVHKNQPIVFTAIAMSEGDTPLYGFCTIKINLEDINDNAPQFTQSQYSTTVWEGNNKGTFVFEMLAFDADHGLNSKVLYHIVDGNHDNAFIIEPAFSGILKTNIVLDREIRDNYRLKVIATDEGIPQQTGTGTIIINIIDINDNQPTFPPHNSINISEGTEIGTVITTVTANDVDTNPVLTYSFGESDADQFLALDRFSGKIVLKQHFDYESRNEYQVKIMASDSIISHSAETILTIRVTDQNDNAPVFSEVAYFATLTENSNEEYELVTVNATDADEGINSQIKFSLIDQPLGFRIDPNTGQIFVNASRARGTHQKKLFLSVVATDMGVKPKASMVPVFIHISESNTHLSQSPKQYRSVINENVTRGTTVVRFIWPAIGSHVSQMDMEDLQFDIVEGDLNGSFAISYPNVSLIVANQLDREKNDYYHLKLAARHPQHHLRDDNATISIFVTVADHNDNAPVFLNSSKWEVEISESTEIKQSVARLEAHDADQENSPNSEIVYDITSGNDQGLFSIDLVNGVIFVNHDLDYDGDSNSTRLVVRACDSALIPLCTLQVFTIHLTDANDNSPRFPVSEYYVVVPENEPIGTSVYDLQATDMDRGEYGILIYSIEAAIGADGKADEGWKLFSIGPDTGIISSQLVFNYEQRSYYEFNVKATDKGDKFAKALVKVMIESRDEYSPQFSERIYKFNWSLNADNIASGVVFGHVTAYDRDKGPDGRVIYQLSSPHPYFKVNRTTGAIMTKKKLLTATLAGEHDISLVVTASSGRQGSLSNMTVVEIVFNSDKTAINVASAGDDNLMNSEASVGLANWALALLICLILVVLSFATVFVFLHMRNRRHKQVSKPNLHTALGSDAIMGTSNIIGTTNNSYVEDPSTFDTMQIRNNSANNGPPKYDEIPPYGAHTTSSNSGAPTTSDLSGSEQSGSSGRGSAEEGDDGDDEEIRMINEGSGICSLRKDGLMHLADGRISEMSVQNTQEYLARLGIVDNIQPNYPAHHCGNIDPMYDVEDQNDSDLTNIIYAKLNDVANGSGRVSCVDETATTAGSIDHNMDFRDIPVVGGTTGMNGSLSSIVHSEEELTGSYNWDYLLDWGPQYQPLAHVFSEIARLKDDNLSVNSGNSGTSSAKSKGSKHSSLAKHLPPPLLTNVAPRSCIPSIMSSKISSLHSSGNANPSGQYLLPRSPISHEMASAAMSPSFSPNLSPLATRTPSVSPHVPLGLRTPQQHDVRLRKPHP